MICVILILKCIIQITSDIKIYYLDFFEWLDILGVRVIHRVKE